MKTRILLTVDTELVWRGDAADADWRALLDRSFDPAGVGVPYQLRVLAEHGLKGCFFVDPMPACRYGIEPIRHMVSTILEAGQEVQLHLHPQWAGPGPGDRPARFELIDDDAPTQHMLLAKARDLLIEAGAPEPFAFRAGSYAANDATLAALATLGLRYDSSHNGSHAPWPSQIGLPPAQIAPVGHAGVVEIPVTQIADGAGLRHLQLCAVSSAELDAALDHAVANAHPVVTIVCHSFELATRRGDRVNATHKRRFDALCALLARRSDVLETAWFTDLGPLPLDRRDAPLPANRLRTLARKAEQFWSNHVDERAA